MQGKDHTLAKQIVWIADNDSTSYRRGVMAAACAGISPKDVDRLFEPFEKVRSRSSTYDSLLVNRMCEILHEDYDEFIYGVILAQITFAGTPSLIDHAWEMYLNGELEIYSPDLLQASLYLARGVPVEEVLEFYGGSIFSDDLRCY